jgi:hypothetical protein
LLRFFDESISSDDLTFYSVQRTTMYSNSQPAMNSINWNCHDRSTIGPRCHTSFPLPPLPPLSPCRPQRLPLQLSMVRAAKTITTSPVTPTTQRATSTTLTALFTPRRSAWGCSWTSWLLLRLIRQHPCFAFREQEDSPQMRTHS